MRKLTGLVFAGLLLVATAVPASAKTFGTVYFDGDPYRTFGNPASVPAGTGTDPIIAFTNFDQGGVSSVGPGEGAHGGRWQVWMATWSDAAEPRLLTDYDEVVAEVEAGNLTLMRAPEADFRCPILPGNANGTS
jgi:hypothetical protein